MSSTTLLYVKSPSSLAITPGIGRLPNLLNLMTILALVNLLLLVTPLACWALTPYLYKRRHTTGATSLMIILLAIGWWGICYAAELWVGNTLITKLFWKTIKYAGIVIVPVFWLTFSLAYANTRAAVKRRTLRLLLIIPTITFTLILTNEWHHFVWDNIQLVRTELFVIVSTDNQFWFWVHTAYSYILLLAGTIILIRRLWVLPKLYRRQALILFAALLPPWVSNIATLSGLVPIPELDLTPVAFSITALLLVWGFTKFQILDITPIARQMVIKHMPSGMLAIDQEQRIVDLNPAIEQMLALPMPEVLGQPVAHLLEELVPLLDTAATSAVPIETELALNTATGIKHYLVKIVSLPSPYGEFKGQLLTFLDITEWKNTLVQQNQFTALVQHSTEFIGMADLEGRLSFINAAGKKLLHLTTQTTSDLTIYDVLPPSHLHTFHTEILPSILQTGSWSGEFYLLNFQDNSAIPVKMSAFVVTDSQTGKPTALAAICQDITARKQILQSLRESEAQARLSAQNQTIVYQLLRLISGELDPNAVMQRAVQTIAQLTGWSKIAILLPTQAESSLEMKALHTRPNDTAAGYDPFLISLAHRAFKEQKSLVQPDLTAEAAIANQLTGLQSQLAVPLKWGIKISGILVAEHQHGQRFTPDDLRLAESITDALVIGLNNARLYNELDKYLLELSIMQSITQTATESLVVEEILRETLTVTVSSLEFEGGFVVLKATETDELRVVASNRLTPSVRALLNDPSFITALTDHLAQGQNTVWSTDMPLEEGLHKRLYRYWRQADIQVCASSFLIHRHIPIGMIILFSTRPLKHPVPTPLINSIGPQVTTAVANARLYQTTAQQHSQLTTLIEATRDGIMLIDQDNNIGVLNEAAHRLLNLPQTTQTWVARPFAAALFALRRHAPQAIRALLHEIRAPLDYDKRVRTGELEIAPRILQWTEVLVIDDHTILGRLFVFRDITEEKQLIQMRDDLTNTIVHDMRNPLTGIKVAVEMLQYMVDEEAADQHMLLDAAQESSEHLIKLINSLLDVSRLESGRMPLNQQYISLHDVAARVIHMEKALVDNKQLTLTNAIPLELPAAYADYSLIERVVQNLVGNAIKFTPANGRIEIKAAPYSEDKLVVSICDNGPGIEPAMRDSLFQKFATGRHENRGSGLGLAFCRLAVEAHGGRIWVESEVGAGTEFNFTLPAESV